MSTITITLKSLQGLGASSYYCIAGIDNDTVNTSTKKGPNPQFNEEFSYFAKAEQFALIQVFDAANNSPVGEHTVQVGTIKLPGAVEGSFPLKNKAGAKVGEVTVKIARTALEKVTVEDFDLLAVVGKGSYGKVMQVRKKSGTAAGEMFAMKVLRKDKIVQRNQVEHTRSEVNVLQNVHHPFMVQLRYSFQTADKLYLILDFVNGGELFFHLSKEGTFAEDRARLYAAEILLALGHLHRFNIIYRDLKPENILLDKDGHIRLTDFGLCKEEMTQGAMTETFCGTPEYMAPEIVSGKPYNKAVDWWTLGTLLYEMLVGVPPFYSENVNTMYQKILTAPLRFPNHISADAKSLLEMMLQRDPAKRLGSGPLDADEIKVHPFFATINWDDLIAKRVETPFKPEVSGAASTDNFDTEFTSEKAVDSVVEGKLSELDQAGFTGFTFSAPSNMGN